MLYTITTALALGFTLNGGPLHAPAVPQRAQALRMNEKLDFMKLMDGEKVTDKPPAAPAPAATAAPAPEATTASDVASVMAAAVASADAADDLKPFAVDGAPAGHEALSEILKAAKGEAAPAAAEGEAAEGEEAAPAEAAEPKLPSCTPSGWGGDGYGATMLASVEALEKEFDQAQDPAQLKGQLVGSWKLLVDSDRDGAGDGGLTGAAQKPWQTVVGHFQTFRKPDPMDILNGNLGKTPLLETTEVIVDSKDGKASTAVLKGGFHLGELTSEEGLPGVVEYYTSLDDADADLPPNRWSCSYLSDTLRVCKSERGSKARRVYAKVEADAATAEIARLTGLSVAVDPAALAAAAAEAAAEAKAKEALDDDDEDDPNDTRPAWQKRVDKADGIKRTKDGTPINNFGPPDTGRPTAN